ncbi:MAG TPA: hypothetical protein VHJ20_11450 [Polyangia bacterium]|nr:hypothetical protein [Polyangia bacterium]
MASLVRSRVGTDFALAAARHLAAVAAGLLTFPLIAHHVGADGLGAWGVLGSATFLLGLIDLGLPVAVQRAATRRRDREARLLVRYSVAVILTLALPVCLLSWFLLGEIPRMSPALAHDFRRAVPIALAGGLIGSLGSTTRALLLVRGALRPLATARALASLTQVAATAGILWIVPSLTGAAVALFLSLSLEVSIVLWAARRIEPRLSLRPLWLGPTRLRRRALAESGAALAINVAVAGALRADVLILSASYPLATVAAYMVAARGVDQIFSTAKQMTSALMHRLGRAEGRASAVRLGTAGLGATVAATMVAAAYFGQPALQLWVGAAAALPVTSVVLALLGAAACVAALEEMPASAVCLTDRSAWRAARSILLGHSTNVLLSLVGARWLGAWSVAAATIVGNVVVAVLIWRDARRLLLWTRAEVARALAPAFAAAVAALLAGQALSALAPRGLAALLTCGAATVAAGGLGAWLGTRRLGGKGIAVLVASEPAP